MMSFIVFEFLKAISSMYKKIIKKMFLRFFISSLIIAFLLFQFQLSCFLELQEEKEKAFIEQ